MDNTIADIGFKFYSMHDVMLPVCLMELADYSKLRLALQVGLGGLA